MIRKKKSTIIVETDGIQIIEERTDKIKDTLNALSINFNEVKGIIHSEKSSRIYAEQMMVSKQKLIHAN